MGRMQLEEEVVDVADLIESSVSMLRIRADEQALQLVVSTASNLPRLLCDRLRLKQALINLLSNAVKFTPKYGSVTVSARTTGDGLALSASDTGMRIRSEDIPRALEASARWNPSSTGATMGWASVWRSPNPWLNFMVDALS